MDAQDPDDSSEQPTPERESFRVRRIVAPPQSDPLPREVSLDETDLGWGDGSGERDDDWYRRERPPHHG